MVIGGGGGGVPAQKFGLFVTEGGRRPEMRQVLPVDFLHFAEKTETAKEWRSWDLCEARAPYVKKSPANTVGIACFHLHDQVAEVLKDHQAFLFAREADRLCVDFDSAILGQGEAKADDEAWDWFHMHKFATCRLNVFPSQFGRFMSDSVSNHKHS